MNRCLNNFFAYCNGTPDIIGDGIPIEIRHPSNNILKAEYTFHRCRLDPKTCPDMVEHNQLAPTNQPGTIQLSLREPSLE